MDGASGFQGPPLLAGLERLSKGLRRALGRDWGIAYSFVAPAVILMGGLIAYPFLRALYTSFTWTRGSTIGPFVGLANYGSLWADRFFREAVAVTVKFTLGAGVLKFAISMIGAILLHRLGSKADLWAGLILLPWIMPTIVRVITWKGLLDPLYGSLNRLLLNLDIIDKAIPFLGDFHSALPSVILVDVWQGIPFFTINLLAGLKSIDLALYEAAAIDGASGWRQFLHITLPGLRYVLIVVNLLSTIWTFNTFELIFLLTGGGPMNATKVYSVLAYNYAAHMRLFGKGSAVAMSVAPVFALAIMALGRHMLWGHRLEEGAYEAPPGPVAVILRALTWPVRATARLCVALFWWVNNAVEWLIGTVKALLTRALARLVNRSPTSPWRRSHRFAGSILPSLFLASLLIFELAPFYGVLTTAFKTELQITRWVSVLWPEPWSLDQFRALLGPQRSFWVWLRNTMIISSVTPVISTLAAALSAYALTRLRWRGAGMLANGVLISYLMPGVMLVIPIYQLFLKLGLTNSLFSLILSYPSFSLPLAIWLMMGYYAAIPEELEAAAMVDGCNRFQTFFRIMLPLSRPALMATALFSVSQVWNEFLFAMTFITSESKMTLPLGLAAMIFGDVAPWGELSAAALIMALPVLALYTLGQRFMVTGLTAGAIKGR